MDAAIIIESYLSQMKDNIIRYEIQKEENILIRNIETRLISNRNYLHLMELLDGDKLQVKDPKMTENIIGVYHAMK